MAKARKKAAKKPAAKAKPKAKAKVKAKPKAKAKPARKKGDVKQTGDAIPVVVPDNEASDTSTRRRMRTAREWAQRSSPVVEILDDPYPIGALRRFLEGTRGQATQQQAQIALGSAQLMLLAEREHRGSAEVKEIIDLVLERWLDFGERRSGFHAREFLKYAFGAIGVDRDRIAKLELRVPADPGPDLLFALATAHAVARDKVAMLRAVERALDAGATSAQFRADVDFSPYANDPDLSAILARAEVPTIPVDVEPFVNGVRAALDSLVATLRELGMRVELRPPVRLDAILDAERARKISLPNDYRAMLTITNGMRVWDREFLGAGDLRDRTKLAQRAEAYIASARIEACVLLASWGGDKTWLVWDPTGKATGATGYAILVDTYAQAVASLASALAEIERDAREELGTN